MMVPKRPVRGIGPPNIKLPFNPVSLSVFRRTFASFRGNASMFLLKVSICQLQ